MTRDDIIRMAREAGFYFHDAGYAPILHTVAGEYSEACFERFAALVASAEREVCAQAAWDIVQYEVHADLADQVAAAIRARSTP